MSKKILSMLLVLSMLLTMLAACNNEPVADPNPDPDEQQKEIKPDDPVELDDPKDEFPEVVGVTIPPISAPYVPQTTEKVLKLNIKSSGTAQSRSVPITIQSFEIPVGATLEYDVYMTAETKGNAFFDIMVNGVGFLSSVGQKDTVGCTLDIYADFSDYAKGHWYHRVIEIPVNGDVANINKASFRVFLLEEGCDYTYYFDNVCVKDSNGNVIKAFSDEDFLITVKDTSGVSCTFEVVDDPNVNSERKTVADYSYFHEPIGTLTGSDVIDMTFSLNELDSCPGLYFGNKDDFSMYGINGYIMCLDSEEMFLYRVTDKRETYATMFAMDVSTDKDITIRMEYDGTFLRGYYLDDAEGVEAWPEFEVKIEGLAGMEYGVMNLRGGSYTLKNTVWADYAEKDYVKPFCNPVIPGSAADPDVLYYEGMYYIYYTAHRYGVYKSPDLVNWEYVGTCVSELTWENVNDEDWWAPDVEYYNGKFYMLVSPNHYLGFAVSDSPTGPFVTVGEPFFREFSIDGNLFIDDDGTAYVYFTGEFSASEQYNAIYGVKVDLENCTMDKTSLTMLLYPEGWERRLHKGSGTVEGVYVLKNNGKYYLIYSGNDYASDYYALGYAVSESPLGPFEKFELNPVFRTTSDIKGPGHNSFIELSNGDIYNVFHYWPEVAGEGERITGINLVRFAPTESGVDRLEFYPPSLAPQETPSVQ